MRQSDLFKQPERPWNAGRLIGPNGSGAATAFVNYSEYGKFGTDASGNPLSAPPGGSPFGYTGRQWDAKAGLYNYRARYYDPALGVFLSMDPIGTVSELIAPGTPIFWRVRSRD